MASSFASDNENDIDIELLDYGFIENIEPVKIEPTLLQLHHQQLQTSFVRDLVTVVSSTSRSSTIPSPTLQEGADEDWRKTQMFLSATDTNHDVRKPPPFDMLPDETVCGIFGFLNVEALCCARCLSKRLSKLASRDEAGWFEICAVTWRKNTHACWRAIQLKESHGSMAAYRESCLDGRHRHDITPTELCFDPHTDTRTIWYFRFKETAGPAWTSLDPWHAGLGARKMVFLRDGTV